MPLNVLKYGLILLIKITWILEHLMAYSFYFLVIFGTLYILYNKKMIYYIYYIKIKYII